ncbi:MAG: Zn-dependent hydrolase [Firmicutes bacterium]|nr:Zn-dependent hydrolase [Bacillota bacterium]
MQMTDATDLFRELQALAQFSQPAPPGGVTRLPWTAEDRAAREALEQSLRDLGLRVTTDSANNLWACWDVGAADSIVIGSHRDSVPSGGRFDGALGIVGGLAVVRELKKRRYRPHHNIEWVAWNDEEGARFGTTLFGSRVYTGAASATVLGKKEDRQNIALHAAARAAGFAVEEMRPADDLQRIRAYFELHIEQGPILEQEHCAIGIVSQINVQYRERITLRGIRVHAAYAGRDRADPIFATARVMGRLQEFLDRMNADRPYPTVTATIGQIDVASHLINAVPPDITWSLDVRADEARVARQALQCVHEEIAAIAQREGFAAQIDEVDSHAVLAGIAETAQEIGFDAALKEMIQTSAHELGYAAQIMPSWAGHDAMAMAPRVPSAMIFVPSHQGLSHTPEEWTDPENLAQGVDVLLAAVLKADSCP